MLVLSSAMPRCCLMQLRLLTRLARPTRLISMSMRFEHVLVCLHTLVWLRINCVSAYRMSVVSNSALRIIASLTSAVGNSSRARPHRQKRIFQDISRFITSMVSVGIVRLNSSMFRKRRLALVPSHLPRTTTSQYQTLLLRRILIWDRILVGN